MASGGRSRVQPTFTQGTRDSAETPQRRGIVAALAVEHPVGTGTHIALWSDMRARIGLSLVCAVLLGDLSSASEPRRWEPSSEVVGLREAGAIAIDPVHGRVAVGDRGGVSWFVRGRAAERVLRRGPVHDLVFTDRGALYAATARGVFRIETSGAVVEVPFGPGGSERVERLAAAAGWVAAAGQGGLFLSRDGGRFAKMPGGTARQGVTAVALTGAGAGGTAGGAELWWIAQGTLFRGRVAAEDPPRLDIEERLALPAGALAREALDLLVDVGGARAAVLAEREVALLRERHFDRVSPPWPAGALARRMAALDSELWVATDRGLVVGAGWAGPWRRAASPAGDAAVAALAPTPVGLWIAGKRGLLLGRRQLSQGAPAGGDYVERLQIEPTVQEVHAAVVRHQGLTDRRMRELARGVRRRGWLPAVTVRGAYGDLRRASVDVDQVVFSSGTLHDLLDSRSDHDRDWEASLALTWQLGDVLYHPESIDVSKESREWVELRDEVLDEVNQLYFERRRVLLELAETPAGSAESARHRLRADELAAGLDAWTGGWFGFRVPALSNAGSRSNLGFRSPGSLSPPPPKENKP